MGNVFEKIGNQPVKVALGRGEAGKCMENGMRNGLGVAREKFGFPNVRNWGESGKFGKRENYAKSSNSQNNGNPWNSSLWKCEL